MAAPKVNRGGRPRGSPNKATLKRQAEIAASGLTPLDYMIAVMRDPNADEKRRDEMARAAAPYVHPKLATVQHTGDGGGPVKIEIIRFSDVGNDGRPD